MLHSTRRSSWRKGALLIVAAMLVMTLSACGSKGTEIATYKGGNVTDTEFDKYIAVFGIMQQGYEQILEIPEFKKQVLEQYISYKIISEQASEESKKKAKDEASEQMKQYKEALKNNPDLQKIVDLKKVKDKDMEQYIVLTSTVVAHMNEKVTEEEIKAEFDKNGKDYSTVTLRHILVATSETDSTTQEQKELRTPEEALARANEVREKLVNNGDWDALAKEYSDDPGSKDAGGLYADKKAGEWVEEFKQASITQELGQIGEPVETAYGYHVIQVEKRSTPKYEELTDAEREALKGTVAFAHMNSFMTDELPKHEIEIKLPEAEEDAAANDTPASDAPAGEETPATDTPATETPAAE